MVSDEFFHEILIFGNGYTATIVKNYPPSTNKEGISIVKFELLPDRDILEDYPNIKDEMGDQETIIREYPSNSHFKLMNKSSNPKSIVLCGFNAEHTDFMDISESLTVSCTTKERIIQSLKLNIMRLQQELDIARGNFLRYITESNTALRAAGQRKREDDSSSEDNSGGQD
ncbi:MAG: hypothetical protein U9O94_08375 [Nanoarchaeota archaeon]|nr:hypothetical protein [Nanoarchaeota archaeon]